MYRCYNCDAPAQVQCECFQEQKQEEPKLNIASGEDVQLEEPELEPA